jgi:hypothetical protein
MFILQQRSIQEHFSLTRLLYASTLARGQVRGYDCSWRLVDGARKIWEVSAMSQSKQASKRKRRTKAVPVLGAAGLFSLAGGVGAASASTGAPAADVPLQKVTPNHEIMLGEEELSDVSLATFYVFDKENAAAMQSGVKVAWRGCGRCGGCGRGCGCGGRGCGWRGCRCGGCGCWGGCGCGCCVSWGGCRIC